MAEVRTAGEGASRLDERAASVRWYQTIELPGGIVTPGQYDLRPVVPRIAFPESLSGKRCLDVGTRDGFWAFEMERRGASEVVGIDLDDPRELDWPLPRRELTQEQRDEISGRVRAFDIAHEALGSTVERRNLSVYDLSPEQVGIFDFAFIGTLLLHLRSPVDALISIRRVVRGELLVNDVVGLRESLYHRRAPRARLVTTDAPFWWVPNTSALRRFVRAAGYEIVKSGGPYVLPSGPGRERPSLRRYLRRRTPLLEAFLLRRGMPHYWMLARPVPDGD